MTFFSGIGKAGQEAGSFQPLLEVVVDKAEQSVGVVIDVKPEKTEKREEALTCKEIGKRNEPTFSKKKPEIPGSPQGDAKKFIKRQEAILWAQELYDRKSCFSILAKAVGKKEPVSSLINPQTSVDLNLFCGSAEAPDRYLGGEVSKSLQTEMGRAFLINRLGHPVDDVEALQGRQAAVRACLPEDVYSQLLSCLEKMQGRGEAELHSFWGKVQLPGTLANAYVKTLRDSWKKRLNRTSISLAATSFYNTGQKALRLGITTLLIPAGVMTCLSATGATQPIPVVDDFVRHYAGAGNEFGRFAGLFATENAAALEFVVAATTVGIAATTIKGSWDWFNADLEAARIVQEKFVYIAKHFRGMEGIYQVCRENPLLSENLEEFGRLEAFFMDPDLEPLRDALNAHTFDSVADRFFYNTGNVLVAWELLQTEEVRQKYGEALVAAAEIDAVVGAAAHIRSGHYSFPEYLDAKSPQIALQDFFNPQMPEEERVLLKEFSLGSSEGTKEKHCIITGANASGKSTTSRAIMDAVLLSQTMGIVPAKKAAITPFSLRTCMPGRDSLGEGQSGLTREVDIINDIRSFTASKEKSGGFVLALLDEPFKLTNKASGDTLASETMKELQSRENVVSIVVTNEPSTLQATERLGGFSYRMMADGRSFVEGTYVDDMGGVKVAMERGFIRG